MNWLKNKLDYWRCEFIYLLGGIPNEHINTVNYKNLDSVVANIKKQVSSTADNTYFVWNTDEFAYPPNPDRNMLK